MPSLQCEEINMLIIELVSGKRCGSETQECTHDDTKANQGRRKHIQSGPA